MRAASKIAICLAGMMPCCASAVAQQPSADIALSPGRSFSEQSGEALFNGACSGCHMPGGVGAIGAAAYPALAADRNLEAAGYPVSVVVQGLRGMPPLGRMMSDAQVAAVVNYLRTHLGNDYRDVVTGEDVAAARR